ncbi:glucosaminidase domain-containing protein [Vibrio profundi]|uniref:glucosaminidase domain-containing protein n=1 Tax=Vibrio profundi TaxID=1774960 RepID=UPI0037368656
MPNYNFTQIGLKIVAITAFGAFSTIGPYLYESEVRRAKSYGIAKQDNVEEPPHTAVNVPTGTPDFASISDTKQKKQSFFDFLRPSIELENARILKERKFLVNLSENAQQGWSEEQVQYAKRLGKLYNLPLSNGEITQTWLNEMLSRVNVLPASLVLTQAANESAWGTSRFATQANNYFGHWCYSKGCGLVPLQRNEGSSHEVAKFSSSQESVHRYFMNVNRNRAYAELRVIREELLASGADLTTPSAATELTNGLLKYSERGVDYVTDLQAMIRHNSSFWVQ